MTLRQWLIKTMALSFIRLAVYLKKRQLFTTRPFCKRTKTIFFWTWSNPQHALRYFFNLPTTKLVTKQDCHKKTALQKFHRMHHTLKDGCILDSFIDFERRILATLQKGDTGAERGFAVLYSYLADVFKFKRVSWGNPTWDLGTKLYPACNLLVADKGTTSMPL